MKKTKLVLLIALSIIINLNTMAQSEFSSNLIGVGVVVADLEKSLDFYLHVIGMKKAGEFEVDEAFGKISGLTGGVPFHVEVLKLEDSADGNVWKLMTFGKEAPHAKSKFIQDDVGVQYITINVTSLDPFLKRINEHKVELLGDTPVPLGPDLHFVLVQDPDGTIIELIGPLE
jgi:catechol 2,3-dioxygenase-like lactoylglutathione lyase family enzyme